MMNRLSKLPLAQLELFSLLVYYELKDAYLVDCCCIDESEAKTFLDYLRSKYSLSSDAVLILWLESDVLFVNRRILMHKLSDLEEGKESHVVVDMSRNLTILDNSDAHMRSVYSAFCGILSMGSTTVEYVVQGSEDLRLTVGLPFVAGWLLGYPCLYRAEDSQNRETTDLSEAASMINLLKLSITATVCVQSVLAEKDSKKKKTKPGAFAAPAKDSVAAKQTVEIMGFSIPESLWESSPEHRAKLQKLFDDIVAALRRQAGEVSRGGVTMVMVSEIQVKQEVHTVPKIAL